MGSKGLTETISENLEIVCFLFCFFLNWKYTKSFRLVKKVNKARLWCKMKTEYLRFL